MTGHYCAGKYLTHLEVVGINLIVSSDFLVPSLLCFVTPVDAVSRHSETDADASEDRCTHPSRRAGEWGRKIGW